MDKTAKKYLRINSDTVNIDFKGSLNQLAQWVNIADIAANIEKGEEYIVQISTQYKEAFETGEVFINKNKTTGVEWTTLMRVTENGQWRFVDDLPIKW